MTRPSDRARRRAELLDRVERAAADIHRSTLERNRAVVAAHDGGLSARAIAEAASLTHPAVLAIVRDRAERAPDDTPPF